MLNILELSEKEEKDKEREKLLLFNHLKSGEELWYIMPINLEIPDGDSIKGSLRIKKNLNTGKISKAVIEIKTPNNSSIFIIIEDYDKDKQKIYFYPEGQVDSSLINKINKQLPEIIGNFVFFNDDNKKVRSFDGFSIEPFFSGVDTFV